MSEQEILLHPATKTKLNALLAGHTQSVMLTGAPGVGKKSTGGKLARSYVNSKDQSRVLIIEPGESGNISIAEISKLKKFLSTKSRDDNDKRAVIIVDSHSMTLEAQNSFLKILEEPPINTMLILTAWQPQLLLPTIRSRLASIELNQPLFSQFKEYFDGYDEAELKKLYLMSGGSPVLVEQMLGDPEHDYFKEIDQAKKLISSSVYDRLCVVDQLSKDKPAVDKLLKAMSIVLYAAISKSTELGRDVSSLIDKTEAVLQAREAVRKNYNTKLTLTLLFESL